MPSQRRVHISLWLQESDSNRRVWVMSPVSLPLLYPAIYRGGVAEPLLCSSGTGRRYPTGGIHQTSNLTGKWHSLLSQTTSIFVADPPRYALPNSRLHLGHRSKPSSTKAVRGVLIFFLALLKIRAPLFFRYPPKLWKSSQVSGNCNYIYIQVTVSFSATPIGGGSTPERLHKEQHPPSRAPG